MPILRGTPEEVERLTAELVAKGATVVKRASGAPPGAPEAKRRERKKANLRRPLVEEGSGPGWWQIPLFVVTGDNGMIRTVAQRRGRGGHERRTVMRAFAKTHAKLTPYVEAIQAGRRIQVVLTRLSTRDMDWSNVVTAMKYVQDAVADYHGVDDADRRWVWRHEQERNERFGVRIDMEILA